MKLNNYLISLRLSILVVFIILQRFFFESLLWIWAGVLVNIYSNNKNHFISLLLVLEILSLVRIFLRSIYIKFAGIIRLVFILMTLRVGEAVLGLALLVKLARWNSIELLTTGIN